MNEYAAYLMRLRVVITALIQDARDPNCRPEDIWAKSWGVAAGFVECVLRKGKPP